MAMLSQQPKRKTGYVWSEVYMWHNNGDSAGWYQSGIRANVGMYNQNWIHYENAETKRRLHDLLSITGILDMCTIIKPIHANIQDIQLFHTLEYIQKIEDLSKNEGGDAGDFAPVGIGSYEIALLAAGGIIEGVKAVINGTVNNAYCLVRPPGHHAESTRGRGFCIFNNIVIGAKYAIKHLDVKRVAILDWDVHAGNGTQQAFYDDPNVLVISIHQDGLFPAKECHQRERGSGNGHGFHFNLPIPPGSGIGCYLNCMSRVVVPAIEAFKPDLIMVSCGFDAAAFDPISHTMLNSRTFGLMAEQVITLAENLCNGKCVFVHEGGYSQVMVPFSGVRVIEQMLGVTVNCMDPYEEEIADLPYQSLQPQQDAIIIKAEEYVKELQDLVKVKDTI